MQKSCEKSERKKERNGEFYFYHTHEESQTSYQTKLNSAGKFHKDDAECE